MPKQIDSIGFCFSSSLRFRDELEPELFGLGGRDERTSC